MTRPDDHEGKSLSIRHTKQDEDDGSTRDQDNAHDDVLQDIELGPEGSDPRALERVFKYAMLLLPLPYPATTPSKDGGK